MAVKKRNRKLVGALFLAGMMFIMGVFLSGMASATTILCYQETANVSTACGGLETGVYSNTGGWDVSYPASKTYDGNWSSYGLAKVGNTSMVYVNYTKPQNVSSVLWQRKYGSSLSQFTLNYTLPSSCVDYYPDVLSLAFNTSDISNSLTFYCYNGSFSVVSSMGLGQRIYEEAIWWNFTDTTPPTITLNSPVNTYNSSSNSVTFNCTGADNLNLSNVSLYLNNSLNATNTPANNTATTFTKTLTEGTHSWNCQACDSSNNCVNGTARTLTIDITPPSVSISEPDGFLGLKTLGSSLTYQETPNSTSTFGSWSNAANAYDGDWGTYGQGGDVSSNYVYINYTIPTGATDATWQVKDGAGIENLTLPSSLIAGGGILKLRVNSETDPQAIWQYYNAITWVTLRTSANKEVYEEGIFWTSPSDTDYDADLNYTTSDTHLDSCWYSLDGGANTSLTDCDNITLSIPATGASHNLTVYSNDTYGNIGSDTTNFSAIVISSESYNPTTYETFTEAFSINVTYDNAEYSTAQAFFWYYNGSWSSHLATKTNHGSGSVFNISIGIPVIASETNTTFFWQIIFDAGEGMEANSTSHNQTILPLVALTFGTECDAGLDLSMYFDFKNEQNFTTITGVNVNYNFDIGGGTSSYKVFAGNLTGVSNLSICLNTTLTSNMSLSYGEIQYSKSGYSDRRWYAFNTTRFTNTTLNTTLYLLTTGEATSFLITIRHPNLSPYIGKYATLLRWYPQFDDYKVVEMIQTDDSGQSIMRVEVEDPDYRIGVYEQDGTLIHLATPIRMACLVNPCTYILTIPDEEAEEYDNFLDMTYDLSFNATSKVWTFIYNDASQDTDLIELEVYKETGTSSTLICEDNSTIWTGVLSCDVSSYSGLLKAVVYRTASPEKPIALEWYDTTTTIFQSAFGLVISAIIALTLALLGIASPVVAIILACVGLIVALFLKTITLPIAIAIGVVGGVVIHWMRKA